MTGHESSSTPSFEVARPDPAQKPCNYPLQELAAALATNGITFGPSVATGRRLLIGRLLARLGLIKRIVSRNHSPLIVGWMGPAEATTFPFSMWRDIAPVSFDCWPRDYTRWEKIFRRHKVEVAFFTCKDAARHFSRTIPGMHSYWLPEACDPNVYVASRALIHRGIDVLELGRRNAQWHGEVSPMLESSGMVHLYETAPGILIFKTRQALLEGLADTKVSVCFPSSWTHPSRSGPSETVTHRYFESIASGCLVLGHCPQELAELFGYSPVVEVEDRDVSGQLHHILANIGDYQEFVNQNVCRLQEVGTWDVRAISLIDTLKSDIRPPS